MNRSSGDTQDDPRAAPQAGVRAAQVSIYNPPGQRALSYRAGTYASFLEGMLAHMQAQTLLTGPARGRSPLATLNVGGESSVALGLLKAWAVVGDVLTFYQERIINEGYLRTATEPRSLLALVRAVGYEPDPGVAAATYLAFTVRDTKGPPAQVTIPAGAGVMSTPKQAQPGARQTAAQQSQTFETAEAIEARAEWNSLLAYVPVVSVAQEVSTATTLVYLAGVETRLKPAATVLLVGDAADPQQGVPAKTKFLLLVVAAVEPDQKNGYTLVTLQPAETGGVPSLPLSNPRFYAFRQQARLFGYNATAWADAPDNVRLKYGTPKGGAFVSADGGATWRPRNASMPQPAVQSLIVNDGSVLAGVAGGGVFRVPSGGGAWESASSGLTRSDIHCLAANALGHLYAGTAGGGVFRSTDDGSTWAMISGGTATLRQDKDGNLLPSSTRLPNTTVRALAAHTDLDTDVTTIYAGTDNGVYHSRDDLSGWEPLNNTLPGARNEMRASTVVNTLAVQRVWAETLVYAGTDNSIYRWSPVTRRWSADNKNLPGAKHSADRTTVKILALCSYTDAGGGFSLLAATSGGVFRYRGERSGWEQASAGLPPAGPEPDSAPGPVVSLASTTDPKTDAIVIFAATDAGLYTSRDDGSSWSAVGAALLQPLFSVASTCSEQLDEQVISHDLAQQFKNHSVALSPGSVVNVQEQGARWLVKDQEAGRTYALDYDGASSIDVSLTNAGVSAVAADAGGLVAAVAPLDGYVETEWPGFAVNPHMLDLDSVRPALLNGGFVALSQPAPPSDSDAPAAPALSEVRRILTSTIASVNEFGRTATTTVVETVHARHKRSFDRRATEVFLQSEQLPLLAAQVPRPRPVQGSTVELAGLVQGFRPNQPLAFTGRQASAAIVADLGGVLRFDGSEWTPAGLPNTQISALACDAQGRLYAGTRGRGLFLFADGADATPLDLAGASANVCALTCDDARGQTLAATEGGGFFVSSDVGQTWSRVLLPVANDVSAFAVLNDGAWFCATDGGGVFVSADGGASWRAANEGLSNLDVRALAADAAGRVFAGTSGGVYVSADRGASWHVAHQGMASRDVYALAYDAASGLLLAGTRGGGVFLSADGGLRWGAAPTGVSNDVRALATCAGGRVYAGTRDVALLTAADGAETAELRSDLFFTADERYGADLDLGIIPDPLAKLFAAQGAPLAKGASVYAAQTGAPWLVLDGAGGVYVVKEEAGALGVYRPSYTLRVSAAPTAGTSGAQAWSLVTDAGFAGLITARPGEIAFGPAATDAATVSEIGFAQEVSSLPNEKFSTVTLARPLSNVFDADTLSVCANVAYATHGETVPLEVLGSGDASRAGQTFTLKKPPLTYVPSPSSPGLSQSSLVVSISSVVEEGGVSIRAGTLTAPPAAAEVSTHWSEVATLYDAGPPDRVYMVRSGAQGQSSVVFGDGEHGARLPTGAENVVATYRSGIGAAGNLDANRLTMLKARPAGVRAVTNPAPASGGVNPEAMRSARANAPLTVRTLGRIVSLLDYEDFARTQPGVGKAQVQIIYGGRTRIIYLTVANEDGSSLPPDSAYYRDLVAAIRAAQASAQPVQVGSYERLLFNLVARVGFDARYEAEQIKARVEASLLEAFDFDRRAFGQGVESSEVIAIIQNAPGVVSVKLESFHLVGASDAVAARLDAGMARWEPQLKQIRPAQLLLINARGLSLDMEPTP